MALTGSYDGLPFHRVEGNLVIQSGELPASSALARSLPPIRTELTRIVSPTGVVGLARLDDRWDNETAQYFVTHRRQPTLENEYTLAGWVLDGIEAIDNVAEQDLVRSVLVVPGG